MSWEASGWAKRCRVGSPAIKALLLCLADYADENHQCYPGQERLAWETEQSTRTVRRQLDQLVNLGAITRSRRFRADGSRTSDCYTLAVGTSVGDMTAPAPALEAGERKTTGQPDHRPTVSGSEAPESGGPPDTTVTAGQSDRRSAEAPTTGQPERGDHRTQPCPGNHQGTTRDSGTTRETSDDESPDTNQGTPDGASQTGAIGEPTPAQRRNRDDDVTRLCEHLADRVEGNGSKRPTITERWRDAARLMLDTDGRTEDQVHRAIEWCQGNEFWRANVLSMPTLREKYDQLRLQAERERAGGRRPANVHQMPVDHPDRKRLASAMDGRTG